MSNGEQWLANHRVTDLWSGPDEQAISFTLVPQWSVFLQVGDQQGDRMPVHYFGCRTAQEGDVWVDCANLGPIDKPDPVAEPDWPEPSEPEPEPSVLVESYEPPTAPRIPRDQVAHILAAARGAGIEPGLLAATAARESNFRVDAYRREPQLAFVRWRDREHDPLERFHDGSIGCMQVLRSNLLAFGVDSDQEAYDPATNYRVGARIIRDNLAAFPDDRWKGVAAYNVGQYGAKIGRIPADNYTDTILTWAEEYAPIFQRPVGPPPTNESTAGDRLIEYGLTLLGTPYVFGGKHTARDLGLDCSGFVCEVLEHCGTRLGNRDFLSAEAIRQKAREIDPSEARVGDLLFFQNTYPTAGASHIGFWMGPGKMLDTHLPAGVQETDLHSPYWQDHWLSIARLPELETRAMPRRRGAQPRTAAATTRARADAPPKIQKPPKAAKPSRAAKPPKAEQPSKAEQPLKAAKPAQAEQPAKAARASTVLKPSKAAKALKPSKAAKATTASAKARGKRPAAT